ncbi:MAG: cytidine deaminase [Lachnospiraceae bacterium]|nr:cytidine deaminase [Lachnospiraceae bacterium]
MNKGVISEKQFADKEPDKVVIKKLINEAFKARKMAYAPYSEFLVGAAALGSNGRIYTGCNIENVSFSATICAERTAMFKGVSDGCDNFKYIAIVGAKNGEKVEFCYPCGICRQVMVEFACDGDFYIIVARDEDDYRVHTLEELLPGAFDRF